MTEEFLPTAGSAAYGSKRYSWRRGFTDRIFLTGYIGRMKNGMAEETAICESLEEAAAFAAGICGMEGAFGYGKKYE